MTRVLRKQTKVERKQKIMMPIWMSINLVVWSYDCTITYSVKITSPLSFNVGIIDGPTQSVISATYSVKT